MNASDTIDGQAELRDTIRQLTEVIEDWSNGGNSHCVILSGPADRGQSQLWRSIYRAVSGDKKLPTPITVDAGKPLARPIDAHRLIAAAKHLETDKRDALLVAAQVLLKESNFAPFSIELLVRLALEIPAAAAYLTKQAASPPPLDMSATINWLVDCLRLLPKQGPCCLVVENIERCCRGELVTVLPLLADLSQDAAAPNGMLLLVSHGRDVNLSTVAQHVMQNVSARKHSHAIEMAPISRQHIIDQCGAMDDAVASEILELSDGSLRHFMALWRELPKTGLIVQEGDEKTWVYSRDDDEPDAEPTDIGTRLMAAVTHAANNAPNPDNAIRSLQLAALQGPEFSVDIIAQALWFLGHREDASRQRHNETVLRLVREHFSPILEQTGGSGSKTSYAFTSRLLHLQLLRETRASERRAEFSLAVAMAIDELSPRNRSAAAWNAIDLYQGMGTDIGHAKARQLRVRVQAPPSPEGREWELPVVVEFMREHLESGEWLTWLVTFCWSNRFIYPHVELVQALVATRDTGDGDVNDSLRMQVDLTLCKVSLLYCEFDDAEEYGESALAIAESAFGAMQAAEALTCLASVYMARWQYHRAKPLLVQALATFDSEIGDQPPTARVLTVLGLTYAYQGDYDRADDLLNRALHILQDSLGESPATANTLNAIGLMHHMNGNPDMAETNYAYALTMRQKILGYHPETAVSLNNLGSLYVDKRQYDRAEEHLRRALAIQVDILGNHPETAVTLMNMASLYMDTDRADDAERCAVRALEINREHLGDHQLTAQTLFLVGGVMAAQSKTTAAEGSSWHAIRMLESIDPYCAEVPVVLRSYGYLLRRMGRRLEAENWEELAEEREAAIHHRRLDIDADLG